MTPVHHAETRLGRLIAAINQLITGGSNAAGRVTLTPGATSTVVTSEAISLDRRPVLFPTTANAAAALATTYVSAVAQGSFTVTHANDASVDRTFNWVALGG